MIPHRHLALSIVSTALLCASAAASTQTLAPATREPMAAGLIVKFRDGRHSPLAAASAMQGHRASAEARGMAVEFEREGVLGTRVLRLQQRRPVTELARLARELQASDANIEYAEPDLVMQAQVVPTDPGWSEQWDMSDPTGGIRAPAAWDISQGFGVRVAVLDTGVLPHADLVANMIPGYDFITSTTTARDGNGRDADASDPGDWTTMDNQCGDDEKARGSVWHGTHVAGTIAALANNGIGYSGVAPKAKVQSVRVLGLCGGATSDIAAGVIWAAGGSVSGVPTNTTPARVLNLSLGGTGACGATMQAAVDSARKAGALVVVAAGNDNVNASTQSPANCKGVLTVGATNRLGGKSSYSNFGDTLGLSAPGGDATNGNVFSLYNNGSTTPGTDSYAGLRGTSMAAPHVAGVAALMLAANSTLPADMAGYLMQRTARSFPVACSTCGDGLLDATEAVKAARGWRAEREPNNTVAQAQYLNVFPARIWGAVEPGTEIFDTYSLYIPPNATLNSRLQMLEWTYNLTTSMELLDVNGKLIRSSVLITGAPEVNHYNNSAKGITVYLRVKGKSMFGIGTSSSYRYELLLDRITY
jgi:serine protease